MRALKGTTILSHVVGWLIVLSLPILFLTQLPGSQSIASLLYSANFWIFNLSYIALFYVHVFWIYPQLYVKKKYFLYVAAILLLFAGFAFLRPFDRFIVQRQSNNEFRERVEGMPGPPFREIGQEGRMPPAFRERRGPHFDVVSSFLFLMIVSLGIALQTNQRLRITEKRALQAERDKVNAELSFLKAQINPHFLFNTLNNIYSLAVIGSEHTADSILKLSNIMRYVTDEVTHNLVPLESEAACIRDYVDLQRLRLSKRVTLHYSESGNLSNKTIPPMILMTFVENTFKYGISNHENVDIMIRLQAEENQISFYTRNRLFETPRPVISTGVGLSNTKQRLAHMYPHSHTLSIDSTGGYFTVTLTINV
ncbi:sensor histidine kinase [Cesiribacter sp. SM1]|uniref:sensor histidine kinase n=1 Tax=Cesiribacter sp. SM1 TaxID=2861196 RepID=UPI001CD23FBD|nr:sensor histidine kinase [Cesiribacter sp. SM1]